jgi:SAM-dependent methyltransferase
MWRRGVSATVVPHATATVADQGDAMTTRTELSSAAQANGQLWGGQARTWAELQEPINRPLYLAALESARVEPGTRYLDAGCGSGLAASLAAARGAQVSGLDASEALLEIARERTRSGDFRHGELENLPFAAESFDVIAGFNSFQFALRPTVALQEARRVGRPGARVIIATWGRPEDTEAAAVLAALRPLLPAPPPGAPGPFALSDERALRKLAGEAGLTPVEVADVSCPFVYPDLATALRGLSASGVAVKAAQLAGEDAVTSANTAMLVPFKKPDGSYRIENKFRFLLATV